MSDIEHLYFKIDFTEDDIQLLLQTEAEEHLHLEFKAAGSLEKTDSKKNEIARDVAAMANADGGLLIYGVAESGTHHAESLSFIDGTQISKEWLENVIHSKVFRQIPGLFSGAF